MTVRTISPDDARTAARTADGGSTASGSLPATGIDARKQDGPHDDLLRSASALTVSTLWSMIESDTESMMFLAEGGGEVPLFEPREAPDDAVDPAAQTRRTKIERPADCAPLIRLRHLLPPQKARGEKALD